MKKRKRDNMKLWLLLLNKTTMKQFKKYFNSEFEMDKFIRKLKYSDKLYVLKDSREDYFIDYMR
jgi:hypothetical protein